MTPAMRDVAIVGGGPAGLYAGLRLSEEGFDVSLLEEHEAVGEPVHCTGIVAEEIFEEFGLPRASILNGLTAARFSSPSGQDVFYSSGRTEAVVVDRRVFDQNLFARARQAGVAVSRGKVTSVEVEGNGVRVCTAAGGEVLARACVLACGANYSLHRRLGLGMPSLFLQTAQMELPARCLGDAELYFGLEVAPKGFGWAVPVSRADGPHVRVGVMCEHNAPVHFRRLAERLAEPWGINPAGTLAPVRRLLPLMPIPRTFGDRLVVVGAAAGLVKPTTGGGIYYGLVSAAIAASVLSPALRGDTLGPGALQDYERRWREQLAAEVKSQHALRMLAHDMTDSDIERLFELARTDGVLPIVRRTASFNRHRKLILALLRHPPVRQIVLNRLGG
jgi:digeranylgeranylglycerophospholipid reductase